MGKSATETRTFTFFKGLPTNKAEGTKGKILPDNFCLNDRYLLKYKESGGYSHIYYAYDKHKDEIVIVKEFYLKGKSIEEQRVSYRGRTSKGLLLLSDDSSKEFFLSYFNRFIREAQKLSKLESIDILPQIYNVYTPDDCNAFIIMELIEGKRVQEIKFQTSNQIMRFFEPLIRGLYEMHRCGIIHRDINFRNIIIHNRRPKLIDLGSARSIVSYTDFQNEENRSESHHLVPVGSAPEHENHELVQDSRTDIYRLANLIIGLHKDRDIQIPEKTKKLLEAQLNRNISERLEIKPFYEEIYGILGEDKRKQRNIGLLCAITSLLICLLLMAIKPFSDKKIVIIDPSADTISIESQGVLNSNDVESESTFVTNQDSNVVIESENATVQEKLRNEFSKENLIEDIESQSGYTLQERYIKYLDFDGDGKSELYAFVPTDIDEDNMDNWDGQYDWINYADVWFANGEMTTLVDSIGMDDWQGGGNYEVIDLQFGSTFHYELFKFYGPVSVSHGPIHIYTVEGGSPVKTYTGGINNAPFLDIGDGKGVFYEVEAYKGSTWLNWRTFDSVYVYYKDHEYIPYSSKRIDYDNLKSYDNYEEAINEGIQKIVELYVENARIIPSQETVAETETILYRFSNSEGCISIYNCYENDGGRIYLNVIKWMNEEGFWNSGVWDNEPYNDPVDTRGWDNHGENEGANFYIVFKIKKNKLEIEEIKPGFWE